MAGFGHVCAVALLICVVLYLISELYKKITEKSFKGDIALLTGGAGGLGRLLAQRLMKDGCDVILVDVSKEAIDEAGKAWYSSHFIVKSLNTIKGAKCYGYVADITNHEKVKALHQDIERDIGHVNILINNAGISTGSKIFDSRYVFTHIDNFSETSIRRVMEVNAISHFWTCKAFMPRMIEKNHGFLVTISSVAGVIGTPGMSDYSASKFSCFALTESIRMELKLLGKSGVSTLTVCPYFMKTPMFADAKSAWPWLFPILDPEEVADRTILSMKRNDGILLLPAFAYFAFLCRFIFPTWLQDYLTLQLGGAINYNK